MANSRPGRRPFRNTLAGLRQCDESFQWKPFETSVLLLHLEICSVSSLTVCSSLWGFQNNKGENKNVF